MKLEKSAEEEIADVRMKRPHVVLLGAGANRQAFPRGERNGRHLPVMADFLKTASFAGVLTAAGISHAGRNFEELYSELALDPAKAPAPATTSVHYLEPNVRSSSRAASANSLNGLIPVPVLIIARISSNVLFGWK